MAVSLQPNTIIFIKDPIPKHAFSVNLDRYSYRSNPVIIFAQHLFVSIKETATHLKSLTSILFSAIFISTITAKSAQILGKRTAAFVCSISIYITSYTIIKLATKYFNSPNQLTSRVDFSKLRIIDESIDASFLDDSIKIEKLKEYLDKIEFVDRSKKEYLRPDFKYNGRILSKDELHSLLDEFISNINMRKARLATPREDKPEELEAFYHYIESAVRLCINEIEKKFTQFQIDHQDALDQNDENAIKAFKALHEDRSKLVFDIAFIAKLCGTAYMSEAKVLHNYFVLDVIAAEDLEATLQKTLGQLRETIAHTTALNLGGNTHDYAMCLEAFKEQFKIPRSAEVQDHIASLSEDKAKKFAADFRANYNEFVIKQKIQTTYRQNASFREQVQDWLLDQVGEWTPSEEGFDEEGLEQEKKLIFHPDSLASECQIIMSRNESLETDKESITWFLELIKELQKERRMPERKDQWEKFIADLFHSDRSREMVKKWFLRKCENQRLVPLDTRSVQEMRNAFEKRLINLEQILAHHYPFHLSIDAIFENQEATLSLMKRKKAEALRGVCSNIDLESWNRIIDAPHLLVENLENARKRVIKSYFLNELLKTASSEQNVLPLDIIEWLLVAHQLLLPRKWGPHLGKVSDENLRAFSSKINALTANFSQETQTDSDDVRFLYAVDHYPQTVLQDANQLFGEVRLPLSERLICLIPKQTAMMQLITSLFLAATLFRLQYKKFMKMQNRLSHYLRRSLNAKVEHISPLFDGKLSTLKPLQVLAGPIQDLLIDLIRVFNAISSLYKLMFSHRFQVFFNFFSIFYVLESFNVPYMAFLGIYYSTAMLILSTHQLIARKALEIETRKNRENYDRLFALWHLAQR